MSSRNPAGPDLEYPVMGGHRDHQDLEMLEALVSGTQQAGLPPTFQMQLVGGMGSRSEA